MSDGLLKHIHRLFRAEWGAIGAVVSLVLIASLVSEKIGADGLFGAFLAGVGLSSSSFFTIKTRGAIASSILSFFTPVFFTTIGLKLNFLQSFDWTIVLVLIVVAYTGKILAAMIGGRLKYIPSKGSMAIGLGIAARAGMGVIWAMMAHNAKIINDPIFTGLIIMAVITSMTAGFIRNLLPSSYGSEDELHTNNN